MPPRSDLLLPGLILPTELCAVFPVMLASSLLGAVGLPYGIFWILLLVGLLGTGAPWLAARLSLSRVLQDGLILVCGTLMAGVVAWIIGWSVAGLAAAVLLLLTYGRGVSLAYEERSHDRMYGRLLLGFTALLLAIAWLALRGVTDQGPIWTALGLCGVAFVTGGMASLAACRLERSGAAGAAPSVFMTVGTQLGLLLALSVASLALFSLNLLAGLESGGGVLGAMAGSLAHVLQPAFSPLGWFLGATIQGVANLLAWLTEWTRKHEHRLPLRPGVSGGSRRHPLHPGTGGWHLSLTGPWLDALAIALALVLLGAIVLLARRADGRLSIRKGEAERGQGRFWQELRCWVRELLSQGARGAEQIMQATRRFLGPSYPSDPVRRIYAQLLRRAEARGLPRPLDATPWEFERLLVARWPEGSQDFAAVTLAYVHRRYGRSLVAGRELDDLQRRGKRLRGLMRERKPAPFR